MANEKISRNDPCPCGSGKKYKKCCLSEAGHIKSTIDFQAHQIRQIEQSVMRKLLTYVRDTFDEDVLIDALSYYMPEDESIIPEDMMEIVEHDFVIPCALFRWIPHEDFDLQDFNPELTFSQNYLRIHRSELNDKECAFIEAVNKSHHSFYSVERVIKNESIQLKDILLGTTITVKGKNSTDYLSAGDIIFASVITVHEISVLGGMIPFCFPPEFLSPILGCRNILVEKRFSGKALTAEDLCTGELLHVLCSFCYFLLTEIHKAGCMPTMNTDDEPIQFCKTHFKLLLPAEETFDRLISLSDEEDRDDFLSDAKRDKEGNYIEIAFPWLKKGNAVNKGWDNTVLGHITIKIGKIIVETNSVERADRIKLLLAERLGDKVVFQNTVMESPQHIMNNTCAQSDNEPSMSKEAQQQLLDSPEIKEQILKISRQHWESWFDESIPALNNMTPREAAKTENGRELLNALLTSYEYRDRDSDNPFKPDTDYLRKELALDVA